MTIKSAASDLEENNGEYFTHIQHKNLASIKNLAPTNKAEKILEDQSLAMVSNIQAGVHFIRMFQ